MAPRRWRAQAGDRPAKLVADDGGALHVVPAPWPGLAGALFVVGAALGSALRSPRAPGARAAPSASSPASRDRLDAMARELCDDGIEAPVAVADARDPLALRGSHAS